MTLHGAVISAGPTLNSTKAKMVRLLGADIRVWEQGRLFTRLLDIVGNRQLCSEAVHLDLASPRDPGMTINVLHEIERRRLQGAVTFHPYFDTLRDFPLKKLEAEFWIDNQTSSRVLDDLESGREVKKRRTVLFVTFMQPMKSEGNSRLMRDWLNQFRRAGYETHLLYYAGDLPGTVTESMRETVHRYCDFYHEVKPSSPLVGLNSNGRNVHVDDWCGIELLDEVTRLVATYSFDIAFVNYAFMSAVFERVHAYTQKVLLTHDRFENRNSRLLCQGLPGSGWMSLTRDGERIACERSDVVIALQSEEADYFRQLNENSQKVVTISPVLPAVPLKPPPPDKKLRIGYFGSHNWINEINFDGYLQEWKKHDALIEGTEFVLAGGLCGHLEQFVSLQDLEIASPRLLGHVNELTDLFQQCDLVINPERGGTGIKIKSLETMAHGVPLLSTRAGTVGFYSDSRFHLAEDFSALAALTLEIVENRNLLDEVRHDTVRVYGEYADRSRSGVSDLIGDGDQAYPKVPPRTSWPPKRIDRSVRTTQYIDANSADYHVDYFRVVAERIDLKGKRILEIGSDYHLISARLFSENGAAAVLATNIGDWKSEEPLPGNVEFRVGDVGDMELEESSFDVIFGIAILEHIPDFSRVMDVCKRVLAPNGVVYLQGCPVWGGSLGHHVWFEPSTIDNDMRERFAAGGSKTSPDPKYRFSDNASNPIPNWAHLALSPAELSEYLVKHSVPQADADGIVDYIHDLTGENAGSCSNFKTASEIIQAFRPSFEVTAISWQYQIETNEFYRKALHSYTPYDLDTLGLELWMRHPEVRQGEQESVPKVSVIIPFCNVEDFISDCLDSVREQDYPSMEIVLVDDQGDDRSRVIAERHALEDERLRIVSHDVNKGLGMSRNSGVAVSEGDYVFFLDSDDLLAGPSVVREMVNMARETGSQVVVGRAKQLLEDGSIRPFDERFEALAGCRANTVYSGIDAFYASFGNQDSGAYLPMRAWGYLIAADFYRDVGVDFPTGPHEDIGHTSVLNALANRVLYIDLETVLYRHRVSGISNSAWTKKKSDEFLGVWRHFEAMLTKTELDRERGNAALLSARQALWKIQHNEVDDDDFENAIDGVCDILEDAGEYEDEDLAAQTIVHLQDALELFNASERLTEKVMLRLPARVFISYYTRMLGLSERSLGSKPPRSRTDVKAVHARSEALLGQYKNANLENLRDYPCMLTEGDKAVYYDAGLHFQGRGTIVDGGCFVGGTTQHLVAGLKANTAFSSNDPRLSKAIKVYDLFHIEDGYIVDHLNQEFPEKTFEIGGSFEGVFREKTEQISRYLEVFPGDVTKSGYPFEEDIEVLGVDLCKALPVTDFVIRTFFPRLMEGALVIQQDFIHEFHPHIHLSMLLLDDHFDLDAEMCWGGSVTYRVKKKITDEIIAERFGSDASWFEDKQRNVGLLEDLIGKMHYDENRWIMILTLGFYHFATGDKTAAREEYLRAKIEFPQFVPSEITRRHLCDEQ